MQTRSLLLSLLWIDGISGGEGSSLDSLTVVSSVDSSLSKLLVDLGGLHFLGQRLDLSILHLLVTLGSSKTPEGR